MLDWYNQDTGLFNGTGWWNSAECITALADMQAIDSKSNFGDILHNTFEINKDVMTTKSDFYDDEGWWALAWIKAYDLTRNQDYLTAAEGLFEDMSNGLNTKCGGTAMYWDKDKTCVYIRLVLVEIYEC